MCTALFLGVWKALSEKFSEQRTDRTTGYIFDLDGVLIDSEKLWKKAWNHPVAKLGKAIDLSLYK